jgi:hypothetical protein
VDGIWDFYGEFGSEDKIIQGENASLKHQATDQLNFLAAKQAEGGKDDFDFIQRSEVFDFIQRSRNRMRGVF